MEHLQAHVTVSVTVVVDEGGFDFVQGNTAVIVGVVDDVRLLERAETFGNQTGNGTITEIFISLDGLLTEIAVDHRKDKTKERYKHVVVIPAKRLHNNGLKVHSSGAVSRIALPQVSRLVPTIVKADLQKVVVVVPMVVIL